MDSRDSSSSSSIAVTRDGGLASAEDGALSAASSLAKEVAMLFQSRKYAECVDVLNQLSQIKEHDPKILHNIAVADFFRDGCADARKFLVELVNVEGIVLYHLHDYLSAKKVLEPLFQNIEPIDEGTALHVCLLLLDLAIATQDAYMFVDVIGYMERAFGVGHMINHADTRGMGQQPSDSVANSPSIPSNASTTDDLKSDTPSDPHASENSFSRTLSAEIIDYETLLSRIDISGQNLSRPSNSTTSNDLARNSSDWSTSADLKFNLALYRVQLLFLTRSLKMAERDLKLAMNIARGRDSSNALFLKSQLELARWNFVKAEKLLKASCKQVEAGSSIIYNNNVGCIFYQWGKDIAATEHCLVAHLFGRKSLEILQQFLRINHCLLCTIVACNIWPVGALFSLPNASRRPALFSIKGLFLA